MPEPLVIPEGHAPDAHTLRELLGHETIGLGTLPLHRYGTKVQHSRLLRNTSDRALLGETLKGYKTRLRALNGRSPIRSERLRLLIAVGERFGALTYKPHPEELAALAARENGLGKDLARVLSAADKVNRDSNGALASGFLSPTLRVTSNGILERVEDTLHTTRGGRPNVLGTKGLLRALNLTDNQSNRKHLVTALGVLDMAGLTHKLPGERRKPGSYAWAHACHSGHVDVLRHVQDNSLAYQLLMRLRDGPQRISDLSSPTRLPGGRTLGKAGGIAQSYVVSMLARRLEHQGHVQVVEKPTWTEVRLTHDTKIVVNAQHDAEREGHLTPDMRRALIGPTHERGQMEQRAGQRLKQLRHWGAYYRTIERFTDQNTPDDQHADVREALQRINEVRERGVSKIGRKVLLRVKKGGPFAKISPSELLERVAPELEKRDAELAQTVRRFARKQQTTTLETT